MKEYFEIYEELFDNKVKSNSVIKTELDFTLFLVNVRVELLYSFLDIKVQ